MKISSFTRLRLAGFVAVALAGGMLLAAPGFADSEKPADPTLLAGPKANKKADGEKRSRPAEMGAQKGFSGQRANKGEAASRMHEALFNGIELTDAQRDQLRTIRAENQTQAKAWREANGEKLSALKEQAKAAREAGDKEKMASVREELKALTQSMPKRGQDLDAIKGVLTPQQQTQFETNLAEIKAARAKQMGEGKQRSERAQKMNAEGGERKQKAEGERKQRPEGERKNKERGERKNKLDME